MQQAYTKGQIRDCVCHGQHAPSWAVLQLLSCSWLSCTRSLAQQPSCLKRYPPGCSSGLPHIRQHWMRTHHLTGPWAGGRVQGSCGDSCPCMRCQRLRMDTAVASKPKGAGQQHSVQVPAQHGQQSMGCLQRLPVLHAACCYLTVDPSLRSIAEALTWQVLSHASSDWLQMPPWLQQWPCSSRHILLQQAAGQRWRWAQSDAGPDRQSMHAPPCR